MSAAWFVGECLALCMSVAPPVASKLLVLVCAQDPPIGTQAIGTPAGQGAPDNTSIDKGAIARAVDEYLAARGSLETPAPSALEQRLAPLSLFGDLRLRQEESFHLDGPPDRHRTRLRLRLGADYQVNDQLGAGLRLTTGDRTDPRSPHVTFGSGFDRFELTIDRVFVRWRPEVPTASELIVGKFDHAFARNPVYGELVWDADLQPEGAMARWSSPSAGALAGVDLNAGAYWLVEQGAAQDAALAVAQILTRWSLPASTSARLSLACYEYQDPTPSGSSLLLRDNAGNATLDRDADGTPDDFRSDFRILHSIFSVTRTVVNLPVTVGLEAVRNLRARGGRDQAFAAGAAVGNRQRAGDWRGYYQWQIVEQESIFSPFAQDDFVLATNFRGHVGGVQYQLMDKAGLHLWGLIAKRERRDGALENQDQWRVRLDFDLRF